jgi:metallophosphoesterase (TIGR03767 family)
VQALTTMGQTIVVGPPDPTNGGYSTLQPGEGEPHLPRTDITAAAGPVAFAITSFAQMSDLHIVDDQSPLRVEFLDRYANPGPPHQASYPFGAAYRAHECMSTQVVDAMCRAITAIGQGPRTWLPLAFTIVTGDAVDNCQYNEVRWYLGLLDGQDITPGSGDNTSDHSVTGDSLGLDINYWHAANRDFEISNSRGPGLDFNFQAGFPSVPQLLGAARQAFRAAGLGMPWFAAYGNHDAMVQGNVPIDGDFYGIDVAGVLGIDLNGIATGTFKRTGTAEPLPEVYTGGPFDYADIAKLAIFQDFAGVEVPADPQRRLLSRAEFTAEHFDTQGTPAGHGFDRQNGLAYYVMPDTGTDLIRHVVLDTTNPSGGARGFLDPSQAQWLEEQLRAGSSRYLSADTTPTLVTQPGVTDTLFVIHSHHTLTTMGDYGGQLEALLLRYPNVILHVNGHNHKNRITPHARAGTGTVPGGFWEVNTAAHIDWPIQSRLFEIAAGSGTISIFTTMVDIDAPLDWRQADIQTPAALASLSRELAANDLQQRGRGVVSRPGGVADRNTQLLLPAPFALPDPVIFGAPVAATRDGQGPVLMTGTDASDQVWAGSLGDAPLPWTVLDGSLRCVCAETNADGRVELLGVNRDGTPFHRAQVSAGGTAWTSWAQLAGQFTSVAAARNADGRLELFGTGGFDRGGPGPAGPLLHCLQVSAGSDELTGWSPLDDQPQPGLTQVAAVTGADGRVVLFGVTSAGSAVLWRAQASPGVWAGSAWQPLGALATATAVGCGGDGTLHLFICDEDGRVQEASQSPGGGWSAWAQLDSDWAGYSIRQLAVGVASGGLTLIGVDTEGQAYTRTQKILGIWGPWTAMSRALRPSLLPSTAPRIVPPGDQSTVLGAPVNLQLAVFGGTSPLTWSYAGLPAGLTGDATGQITGMPQPTGVSAHPVTMTATDANYLTDAMTFTWNTLVQVPNVTGGSQARAELLLPRDYLAVGRVSTDSTCLGPAGEVLRQSPVAGSLAPEASAVDLTVSTGLDRQGRPCGALK